MVGRLIVEDEYTINVKLRRPMGGGGECLPPPTITIAPDAPVITLMPPPNSTLMHAEAAKSVNGSAPVTVGCTTATTMPESPTIDEDPVWPSHRGRDVVDGTCERRPHPLPILPPPPPVRRSLGEHHHPPEERVTHGCLRLPIVQVFADDDTLVATNKFSAPAVPPTCQDQPPAGGVGASLAVPQESEGSTGSGSLYVPRIPAHCKSDSGVLYVPPVQETSLRLSKWDQPPAKSNSRRKKTQRDGEDPPVPPQVKAGRTPPEKVPPRSSSSKEAARALLSEVLSSRIESRPPSPRPRQRRSFVPKNGSDNLTVSRYINRHKNINSTNSDNNLSVSRYINKKSNNNSSSRNNENLSVSRYINRNNNNYSNSNSNSSNNNNNNSNNNHIGNSSENLSVSRYINRNNYNNNNTSVDNGENLSVSRYINRNKNNYYNGSRNGDPSLGLSSPQSEDSLLGLDFHTEPSFSKGERVVEVYGGVAAAASHGHPTASGTVSSGGGGGRAGHGDPTRPQPVDPALLTSLDLESDHHTSQNMLVADAPHSTPHPHDLNHNNHVFGNNKPSEGVSRVTGRAAKYVVSSSHSLSGRDNYGFESELAGHDNYGYDPGYGSERSPEEEEEPPLLCEAAERERNGHSEFSTVTQERQSLGLTPGEILTTHELRKLCPFINEGTTFEVTVIKNLRGLGLAVTGGVESEVAYAGLIRIKKLYPQTPAWLCGQLKLGDILLQANTHPLTGLTSHEALEMLRTAGQEVTLEVCRPPEGALGDGEDTPDAGSGPAIVSTSLTTPNAGHNYLSPSPSFSNCGEFEVNLTKVAGSLGFTLRKQDNSILGHTIRTLVKEPAISDGRIRPGDKIISVNDTDMCSMSHEEAIGFLRTCPDTVTLRLYRDAMQTPVSPVSPTEPDVLAKPKALRQEARDMLTDLAFRKQSPSNSPSLAGMTSSPGTPRRRRLQKTPSPDIKSVVIDRWDSLVRKTEESLPSSPTLENRTSLKSIREADREVSPFGDSQTDESTSSTLRSRNSSASSCSLALSDSSRPKRPSFLDLSSGRGCSRKSQFTPPHEVDQSFPSPLGAQYPSVDSLDSAPQLTSAHSDTPAFTHLQQGYQSVNLGALHPHEDSRLTNTTSDHNLSSHDTDGPQNSGLLKWKGIVFTPEEEETPSIENSLSGDSLSSSKSLKSKLVTIELNRGWNSRLGFSLQPVGDSTVITAIYADSVAAKDGRLRIGDKVVKVNGTEVSGWDSESVIDLLRKTRGKISLSVIQ